MSNTHDEIKEATDLFARMSPEETSIILEFARELLRQQEELPADQE